MRQSVGQLLDGGVLLLVGGFAEHQIPSFGSVHGMSDS